ncbi:hypothetical protein ACFWXK_20650 [Streptomyces sp. NPDC059070]|uniref:hypothetical protein n=1 Tax=Streptomyces sp. NPDC059070 TaxID=3346713 RepID=UPI0036CB52A9
MFSQVDLRPVSEDVPDHRVWSIEARPEREGPVWWHAWIRGPVPEHLVDGLVGQLLSTAPVVRGMFNLDHYGASQRPSPLTPEQVTEAHFQRLDTVTAQARARQRTQRLTARTPAAPAPPAARASARPR